MENTIKGLLVVPGADPVMLEVENTVRALQNVVGGYFKAINLCVNDDIILLCNENGKNDNLKPNFWFDRGIIVGTALFVGVNALGDDFDDLPVEYARSLKQFIPAWRKKMNDLMEAAR